MKAKLSNCVAIISMLFSVGAFAQTENEREDEIVNELLMGNDTIKMSNEQQAFTVADVDVAQGSANEQTARAGIVEVVDIVVFYRNQYRFNFGIDEIITRIEDLVDFTNQAFADSDISVELNLVSIEPASTIPDTQNRGDSEFIPDTNIQTAFQAVTFDALQSGLSTFESDVIRTSGTDLYALIDVGFDTEFPEFAGIAFVNGPLSVSFDFGLPFRRTTFAHEVGHNFGGGHEIEDDPTSTRDNHAFECNDLNTILFSTVSRDTTDTFSSPDIQMGTDFCGVLGAADNVRNINAFSPSVQQFGTASESASTASLSQSSYEINESEGELIVGVTRTGNLTNSLTLKAKLTGITAQAELDFFDEYQTVTFNPNENLVNIRFPIVSDAVPEDTETAQVELLFSLDGEVAQDTADVTIFNGIDGQAGEVFLSVSTNVIDESESATVTLNRNFGSDGQQLYKLEFIPSAVPGGSDVVTPVLPEEFNRSLFFVLFEDGETQKTFSLSPLDDTLEEGTEMVQAALLSATSIIDLENILVIDNDSVNADVLGTIELVPLEESGFKNNRDSVNISIIRSSGIDTPVSAVLTVSGDGEAVQDDVIVINFEAEQLTNTVTIPLTETVIVEDTPINLTLTSDDIEVSVATTSFTLLADVPGEPFLVNANTGETLTDESGTFAVNVNRNLEGDNILDVTVFIDELVVNNQILVPAQSQSVQFGDGDRNTRLLEFVINDIDLTNSTTIPIQIESSPVEPVTSQINITVSPVPVPVTPVVQNNDSGGSSGGALGNLGWLLLIGVLVRRNLFTQIGLLIKR